MAGLDLADVPAFVPGIKPAHPLFSTPGATVSGRESFFFGKIAIRRECNEAFDHEQWKLRVTSCQGQYPNTVSGHRIGEKPRLRPRTGLAPVPVGPKPPRPT
jgi:hypothetical protein